MYALFHRVEGPQVIPLSGVLTLPQDPCNVVKLVMRQMSRHWPRHLQTLLHQGWIIPHREILNLWSIWGWRNIAWWWSSWSSHHSLSPPYNLLDVMPVQTHSY